MRHQSPQHRAIRLARQCELARGIIILAGMLARPIIERPIGRPGIEGQHFPIRAKPGHVAHPAQVQDGKRLRQRCRKGAMEYRH